MDLRSIVLATEPNCNCPVSGPRAPLGIPFQDGALYLPPQPVSSSMQSSLHAPQGSGTRRATCMMQDDPSLTDPGSVPLALEENSQDPSVRAWASLGGTLPITVGSGRFF